MKLKTKFQDEDFELGEVVEGVIVECLGRHEEELRVIATAAKGGQHTFYYSSIKKFMDEWEDYEEPKEHWYINYRGEVYVHNPQAVPEYSRNAKSIGNYFETKEEAKKAVEKLKAWQRLKDKGLRFDGYDVAHKSNGNLAGQIFYDAGDYSIEDIDKEMALLFGGEE